MRSYRLGVISNYMSAIVSIGGFFLCAAISIWGVYHIPPPGWTPEKVIISGLVIFTLLLVLLWTLHGYTCGQLTKYCIQIKRIEHVLRSINALLNEKSVLELRKKVLKDLVLMKFLGLTNDNNDSDVQAFSEEQRAQEDCRFEECCNQWSHYTLSECHKELREVQDRLKKRLEFFEQKNSIRIALMLYKKYA